MIKQEKISKATILRLPAKPLLERVAVKYPARHIVHVDSPDKGKVQV